MKLTKIHLLSILMQYLSFNLDYCFLQLFSRDSDHQSYCLAHLFTDQVLESGVLGLAYVGNGRRGSAGGICSARTFLIVGDRRLSVSMIPFLSLRERRAPVILEFWFDFFEESVPADCYHERNGACDRT